MSTFEVSNNCIRTLLQTKSSDCTSDFLRLKHSSPYNSTGSHLLVSKCKNTSSDAVVPTRPKIAFAALKNDLLHTLVEHLKASANNNACPGNEIRAPMLTVDPQCRYVRTSCIKTLSNSNATRFSNIYIHV